MGHHARQFGLVVGRQDQTGINIEKMLGQRDRIHGAFLDHDHAAVLPSDPGAQDLCDGTPGSLQRGESHKKAKKPQSQTEQIQ
jgi:hypothetical protein